MKDFFDFDVNLEFDKPKIKISLKKAFKKSISALRPSGIPYSGVELGFYEHHLGELELAKSVWTFRKSLCDYRALTEFLRDNGLVSNDELEKLNLWLAFLKNKTAKNHLAAMRSDSVRENVLKAAKKNGPKSSERLKSLWKTNREEMMTSLYSDDVSQRRQSNFKKHLEDPDNYEAYLCAMRSPERIEKISKAAKDMWKSADAEKIKRMRNSVKKKFVYRNKKMNSIEHKIAIILDTLQAKWEYEPITRFDRNFLQPDFVIDGAHAIECFGDFWHAHPDSYDDDCVLFSTKTAGEVRKFDANRIVQLKTIYKSVTILWEREILDESINERLKEIINGFN